MRSLGLLAVALGRDGVGRLQVGVIAPPLFVASSLRPQDLEHLDFETWSGFHHIGTARMHTDPLHGVVDADCRVHSVSRTSSSAGARCSRRAADHHRRSRSSCRRCGSPIISATRCCGDGTGRRHVNDGNCRGRVVSVAWSGARPWSSRAASASPWSWTRERPIRRPTWRRRSGPRTTRRSACREALSRSRARRQRSGPVGPLEAAGIDRADTGGPSGLRAAVIRDYRSGDTVLLDGWLISRTEARYAALLTLRPS